MKFLDIIRKIFDTGFEDSVIRESAIQRLSTPSVTSTEELYNLAAQELKRKEEKAQRDKEAKMPGMMIKARKKAGELNILDIIDTLDLHRHEDDFVSWVLAYSEPREGKFTNYYSVMPLTLNYTEWSKTFEIHGGYESRMITNNPEEITSREHLLVEIAKGRRSMDQMGALEKP